MSLLAWLPLINDIHSQGTMDVTVENFGMTIHADGKLGTCYEESEPGKYIKISNITVPTDNWTMALWFYPYDALSTGIRWLIAMNGAGTDDHFASLGMRDTRLLIDFNGKNYYTPTDSIVYHRWQHCCCTCDGDVVKIYINGELMLNLTSHDASAPHSGLAWVGTRGGSDTSGWPGRYQDVRIYDRALSRAEVHELSQGLVLHYKLDSLNIDDSSGYNNNGALLGTSSLETDSPIYGGSINLSTATSCVDCGRGGCVTDAITVAVWLKGTTFDVPLSCTQSGGWNFYKNGTTNNLVAQIYNSNASSYWAAATTYPAANLCDNNWHMIAFSYDRLNNKLYAFVDGVKSGERDTSDNTLIHYNSTAHVYIGAEATATSYTAGMIGQFSDFRIYATALSEADIKALYDTHFKIDNTHNIHGRELVEFNNNATETTTSNDLIEINDASPNDDDNIVVSVELEQGGSGTPSPTNIRPFNAHNDISIYATDFDPCLTSNQNLLSITATEAKLPLIQHNIELRTDNDGWIYARSDAISTTGTFLTLLWGKATSDPYTLFEAGTYTLIVEEENLLSTTSGANIRVQVYGDGLSGDGDGGAQGRYFTESGTYTITSSNYIMRVALHWQAGVDGQAVNGRVRLKLQRGTTSPTWSMAPQDYPPAIHYDFPYFGTNENLLAYSQAKYTFPTTLNTISYHTDSDGWLYVDCDSVPATSNIIHLFWNVDGSSPTFPSGTYTFTVENEGVIKWDGSRSIRVYGTGISGDGAGSSTTTRYFYSTGQYTITVTGAITNVALYYHTASNEAAIHGRIRLKMEEGSQSTGYTLPIADQGLIAPRNLIINTNIPDVRDNALRPRLYKQALNTRILAGTTRVSTNDEHGICLTAVDDKSYLNIYFGGDRDEDNSICMNGLVPGETYTFSFDYELKMFSAGTSTAGYYFRFYEYELDPVRSATAWTQNIRTDLLLITPAEYGVIKKGHEDCTFTITDTAIGVNITLGESAAMNGTGDFLKVKNIRLTKGSVPQPWTPAPEDLNYYTKPLYSGTIDVKNNTLTTNVAGCKISDLGWRREESYSRFISSPLYDIQLNKSARTIDVKSSAYQTIADGSSVESIPNNAIYGYSGSTEGYLYIKTTDYTDLDDFLAAMGDQVVIYPLNSATTYQLPPQSIALSRFNNYIWSDDGTLTITYHDQKSQQMSATGQLRSDEFKENSKAAIYKNGLIESVEFIEM